MDIRERILAAVNWEEPDKVPLTIYEEMLPRGSRERMLRECGIGLVLRLPAYRLEHRQVEITTREYWENGRKLIRKTIHTPVGDVWQTLEPDTGGYGTSNWIKEHYVKKPEDFKTMAYFISDPIYRDNNDYIKEAVRRMGRDGIVAIRVAKSPMQEMLYRMMGLERFSIDYHERRDLVDFLHDTTQKRYEEIYALAAETPVEIMQLSDNITGDVVGGDRYRKYLMPGYRRMKELLRGTGKKLAVHMDGRLASLSDEIAEAEFDIVEALTPPPVGDVEVKKARQIWPDKMLWLNFTSTVHVESVEAIEAHARKLIEEAGTKRGFAIGVTEDAPIQALERSLETISKVIRDY